MIVSMIMFSNRYIARCATCPCPKGADTPGADATTAGALHELMTVRGKIRDQGRSSLMPVRGNQNLRTRAGLVMLGGPCSICW
jgi:hypothetical protein